MTEEQRPFLVKAERFLDDARLLLREGSLDSAVSRLYYVMFYCAELLLETKQLDYSSHRGVLSGFSQHFIKTRELPREMSDALHDAFQKRYAADYTAPTVITREEVDDLLVGAERFLERTKSYLDERGLL